MKNGIKILFLVSFAVLLIAGQAEAQIPDPPVVAWDIEYEGGDPCEAGWTEAGSGAGIAVVKSDPNDLVDPNNEWLHINTTTGAGSRYYVAPIYGEPNAPVDPNLGAGVTVTWRCRLYSGNTHEGGIRFGDGFYGVDIRYGYSAPSTGWIRFENGDARRYWTGVKDQWHKYWVTVFNGGSYRFWKDGVEIHNGVPAYDGAVYATGTPFEGYFGDEFHFGDMASGVYDAYVDYDYIRIKIGAAVQRIPDMCGDVRHPYTDGDVVKDCVTDMNDLAAIQANFFADTRP